jgi:hypothetical protein
MIVHKVFGSLIMKIRQLFLTTKHGTKNNSFDMRGTRWKAVEVNSILKIKVDTLIFTKLFKNLTKNK